MPRVNRVIELLEQGQPVYYTGAAGRDYEGGKQSAGTWADFVNYDMEHGPFDVVGLREFMRGLVDAGKTRSGHRTPAVIVTLPMDAINEAVMRANSWVIKQLLASGVHGLLLCHAESPDAVRAFVECCRYPFNTIGVGKGLQVGRRGGGGQQHAAQVWGLSTPEYLKKADPWPLNPEGELFLGLKIENVRALSNVEATLRVPGIAFAEWGPGDMGMSLGHPDQHDPPYPPEMIDARSRVLSACKANNIRFLNAASPNDVIEQIGDGAMVLASGRGGEEAARIGRAHTKRTMPV